MGKSLKEGPGEGVTDGSNWKGRGFVENRSQRRRELNGSF